MPNMQEYWVEYGHFFYSKYAPKTDTVFAVLLLLVVFSVFGPVAQRSKYQHACSFLITAAIKGWGLREGGTKEVRAWVGLIMQGSGRFHAARLSFLLLWPSPYTRRSRSGGGRWSKCAPRRVSGRAH